MSMIDLPTRRPDFYIKWGASLLQILGYTFTAYDLTPWNLYFFFGGLIGWFTVGILWNDRAIMLIHVIAFAAMVTGMISS
ncbi:MAG: DUF6552 family protein [Thalassovita sp.]